MIISKLKQTTSFIRKNKYNLVGTKLSEKITYETKKCQQFQSLFCGKTNHQNKDNKFVNRTLLGCLFSRIIGSNFPLSIYISQSVIYHSQIMKGQQVVGIVEVVKDLGKNRYELDTKCEDKDGNLLMSGKAVILQQ